MKFLRFFLRFCNFIKMFIYYVNEIVKLLNRLLKKDAVFEKGFK